MIIYGGTELIGHLLSYIVSNDSDCYWCYPKN